MQSIKRMDYVKVPVSVYFGTEQSIYQKEYVPHEVKQEGDKIVIKINDKFSLSFSLKRTNNWSSQNYYVLEYSYVINTTKISPQNRFGISLFCIERGDEYKFDITHLRQFKFNNLDKIHEKVQYVIADFEKVMHIVYPNVSSLFARGKLKNLKDGRLW
jgi:hypothetical protein